MHSIKYILKRIIIGVGIALALMFIKGNLLMQVQAKSLLTNKAPAETYVFNNTTQNFTTSIDSPFFKNAGIGYLYFTFNINKVSGTSVAPVSLIRSVVVFSGSTGYVCELGSPSLSNSTYGGITYTARCPVNLGGSGVSSIKYFTTDLQANDTSSYRWTNEGYFTFESDSSVNVNVDTSSTTNAINNQTTTITNNANNNTNQIINNQNQNTQEIKDEINDNLKDGCHMSINKAIYSTLPDINTIITDNLPAGTYTMSWKGATADLGFNLKMNSFNGTTITTIYGGSSKTFTLSSSASIYVNGWTNNNLNMYDIQIQSGSSVSAYEPYGQQVCGGNKIDKVNDSLNNVNSSINNVDNTINNSNVGASNDLFSDYIEDFDPNTHGLTRIVLAPLQLVSSILDTSCSSFSIPLPFVNSNVVLPCMSTIYNSQFPHFLVIYRLITDGIVSYWVSVNVFRKVKGFLDPTDDKVEVFDL